MIETQILLWKTIQGYRLVLGLFYFILNSPPLIHDVTCSRLYLDGNKYEEEMSDRQPNT